VVVAGRRKSIAFFIALGVLLIAVSLLLYVGWVLLDWRTGILVFWACCCWPPSSAGWCLNTTFLVRESGATSSTTPFINAVTHELKTRSLRSA